MRDTNSTYEVEPRSPRSSSNGPTSSAELHPSQVEDKVLESVLQGRLVHPEVVRSLMSDSVRGRAAPGDPDPLTRPLPDPDGTSESPALSDSSYQPRQDGLERSEDLAQVVLLVTIAVIILAKSPSSSSCPFTLSITSCQLLYEA